MTDNQVVLRRDCCSSDWCDNLPRASRCGLTKPKIYCLGFVAIVRKQSISRDVAWAGARLAGRIANNGVRTMGSNAKIFTPFG